MHASELPPARVRKSDGIYRHFHSVRFLMAVQPAGVEVLTLTEPGGRAWYWLMLSLIS